MAIEKISATDTLNSGRQKINNAIQAFENAVFEGDSSVEAAAARVTSDGKNYKTLQERLNAENQQVTNDIDSVNRGLAQKASQVELNVLKGRIDNIIALPPESSINNARLEDINVGADGKTYNSPGEAVRGQIAAIKTNFTSKQLFDVSKILYNKKPKVPGVATYNEFTDLNGYNTFEQVLELPVVTTAIYIRTNLDSDNIQFFGYKEDGKWDTAIQINTATTVRNTDGTYTFKIPYQNWAVLRYLRCGFNASTNTTENILIMYESDWDATADSSIYGTIQIMKDNVVLQDTTKKKIFASTSDYDLTFSENTYLNIKNGIKEAISNPCNYTGDEIYMLGKGICIGDSVTEGLFDRNDSGSQDGFSSPVNNWVNNLIRMTGLDLTNKGTSGKTFKTWWDIHKNDNFSGYKFAIIALGVNDGFFNGSWTDEAKENLTYIVTALRTQSKDIKIFITTPPMYWKGYTGCDWNSVADGIRTSSVELGLYLVDFRQYLTEFSRENYNKVGVMAYGHPNAYGYYVLAKGFKSYISYIVSQNMDDFRNIQFIGTNYSYNA